MIEKFELTRAGNVTSLVIRLQMPYAGSVSKQIRQPSLEGLRGTEALNVFTRYATYRTATVGHLIADVPHESFRDVFQPYFHGKITPTAAAFHHNGRATLLFSLSWMEGTFDDDWIAATEVNNLSALMESDLSPLMEAISYDPFPNLLALSNPFEKVTFKSEEKKKKEFFFASKNDTAALFYGKKRKLGFEQKLPESVDFGLKELISVPKDYKKLNTGYRKSRFSRE